MEQTAHNDINLLIGEHYVPSALERKKSLMMYVVWGILLSLSQQKASSYEQFHLKQALGRRTMFFLILIPAIVMMFIPWIRVIPFLAYTALFSVRVIFFMQAWNGTYTSFSKDKAFLPVFTGFGGWVLSIFDATLTSDTMQQ